MKTSKLRSAFVTLNSSGAVVVRRLWRVIESTPKGASVRLHHASWIPRPGQKPFDYPTRVNAAERKEAA